MTSCWGDKNFGKPVHHLSSVRNENLLKGLASFMPRHMRRDACSCLATRVCAPFSPLLVFGDSHPLSFALLCSLSAIVHQQPEPEQAAMLSLSSSSPFFFLFLFPIFSCIASSSPLNQSTTTTSVNATITLPLSHFRPNTLSSPPPPPSQQLRHLAEASLIRARHLKNPKSKHPAAAATPLFPRSYGGYSISLSFGTPPQTIPFVMDTGSDVVWSPCTRNYICKNCSFSSNQKKIPSFIPKASSSSKILGCLNPKCGWIHKSDAPSRCRDCRPDLKNCTQICGPYLIIYGSGSTGGIMLSETLDLPGSRRIPDIIVGCSLFSSRQPAGIAGFGRGQPSLPSQLGLNKFSYCLLSHRFDDSGESSAMVLGGLPGKTPGVSYTPFVKNPITPEHDAFAVYYYVALRKITVRGRRVKIPYEFLTPGPGGNGGAIVDSGTTFTFMTGEVFDLVAKAIAKGVNGFARAAEMEKATGLRPCFNISGAKGAETVSFPEMSFHFKGGAEMKLPLANYFSFVGEGGALCFTVITDGAIDGKRGGGGREGPAIILGNYQMQNFNVEYDLKNEKFGFRPQRCNR